MVSVVYGDTVDPFVMSALEGFQAATDQRAIWNRACALFAELGSVWLTHGATPGGRTHEPVIRTVLPAAMMGDYISAGLHRQDRWLDHCAATPQLDVVDLHDPVHLPQTAFVASIQAG
jgi:hypothetical protein